MSFIIITSIVCVTIVFRNLKYKDHYFEIIIVESVLAILPLAAMENKELILFP